MIIYGYAKDHQYTNDGTFQLQVRVPSIHGPYKRTSSCKTYTKDADLPWYTSVLMSHIPTDGEVVVMESVSSANSSDYIVIGTTGGSYLNGLTL